MRNRLNRRPTAIEILACFAFGTYILLGRSSLTSMPARTPSSQSRPGRAARLPLPMVICPRCCSPRRRSGSPRVGLVPVPRARDHDLDAVRAGLQPAARLRRACRRSATARSSASAPTRSACCSSGVSANLWFDLAGAVLVGRAARGALVARLHLAPARHLLRAADDRLRPGVLVRRHQVAQRDRRRGRPAQHQAAAARLRLRRRSTCSSNEALFYFCARACSRSSWSACGGWSIRRSAACSRRSGRTRCAPRFVGYNVWLYKWLAFIALGGDRRAGRRAVRDGAAVGLSERDEPAPVGLRRDDGADRRRPGELLGAGDRRGCSSSSRATCSAPTPRPGCSGTACCSWRWCCSSPRASPASGRRLARARRAHRGRSAPRVSAGGATWRSSKPRGLHKRFGDQRRAGGHEPRVRGRRSCRASWARTAPARPPASTC